MALPVPAPWGHLQLLLHYPHRDKLRTSDLQPLGLTQVQQRRRGRRTHGGRAQATACSLPRLPPGGTLHWTCCSLDLLRSQCASGGSRWSHCG
eukprot:1085455-Pelagomonas_calceolata.AAC.4